MQLSPTETLRVNLKFSFATSSEHIHQRGEIINKRKDNDLTYMWSSPSSMISNEYAKISDSNSRMSNIRLQQSIVRKIEGKR